MHHFFLESIFTDDNQITITRSGFDIGRFSNLSSYIASDRSKLFSPVFFGDKTLLGPEGTLPVDIQSY